MREFAHMFSLERMAKILGVTRQGFYAHLRRKGPRNHSELQREVIAIHRESKRLYGAPKIHRELRRRGLFHSRKLIAKLMKMAGIRGVSRKRRRPRTTDSKHNEPIAPNLLQRAFTVMRSNVAWVSDITYLRTVRGWLYLCVIIDLHSRKIVGWKVADHMRTELVLETLQDARAARRPKAGLIFHSDRGSQYASRKFRKLLSHYGMKQSMSRQGDCWDNAVAESVFGVMKAELPEETFASEEEVRRELFEYIEVFYNRKRLHSHLGYLTPVEFENENAV